MLSKNSISSIHYPIRLNQNQDLHTNVIPILSPNLFWITSCFHPTVN